MPNYRKRVDGKALPCVRCESAAGVAVWSVCADKYAWHVLCEHCDLEANEWLLSFLRIRGKAKKRRPVTKSRLMLNGLIT